ncbi:MAG: selenide, water dikinase SelD, partial [Acidobacteriota bacterium]
RTSDDAGVYRLTDETALVQTVDYITPVVDDPYRFGQIAAANSMSDVYAMGAEPITVLNICNFPTKGVKPETLRRILEGGYNKIREAGAVLLGGHSVKDDELKYGLAVTGIVHPDRLLKNSTARPGDVLVLTKPIGTGVLSQAEREGRPVKDGMAAAVRCMTALNRQAAEAMVKIGVHACTDITGFGLAGHSLEMARGSGVEIHLEVAELPLLPGVLDLIRQGVRTGNTAANQQATSKFLSREDDSPEEFQELVHDPQTSGGLLISVAPDRSEDLLSNLIARGVRGARRVGSVKAGDPRVVLVGSGGD